MTEYDEIDPNCECDTVEEITHKAIKVALSVSQAIQDIVEIRKLTLPWDNAHDRLRKIHDLTGRYMHNPGIKMVLGENFGFIVRDDLPSGKVYLIPDELLELKSLEEIRDWIKSHPGCVAVMENLSSDGESQQ